MQQVSDPCFSAYDCLSISTTSTGTKGMQNGHWQPCRISLSAKSGCFLSLLSLDVFMRAWEFSTMKSVGCELSEWPRRRGVLKSIKRERERGMDETEGGRKVERGSGAPLPGPRQLGWQPHLGFRRLLSRRGKEGLFFTWALDKRCFVCLGRGDSGEYGWMPKEE